MNAEWALRAVSESLHALFSQFSDAYLRERSTDLDDVIGRIQLNLRGTPDAPSLSRLPGPVVLVAGDLTPSEAAELDWDRVLAIVTDVGSSTYHTAIIARSLGIPAVAGLKEATRQIPPGSLVAVDGTRGEVVVEPSGAALESFGAAQEVLPARGGAAARDARPRRRGRWTASSVRLEANVEFPEEAATAQQHGAEGIGLFRSEYLLGRGLRCPTEEQQLDVYRRLRRADAPAPGHRAHLGRGARGARPVGAVEPEPGARRAGAAPAAPLAGALPGAAAGAAAGRAPGPGPDHVPVRERARRTCAWRSRSSSEVRAELRAEGVDLPRGRAGRREPRGAERGRRRRPAGAGGGLLQRRHERPHPVPARGGPDGPARLLALRAAAPGGAAHAGRGSRAAARRTGGRSRSAARWRASRWRPCCSSASASATLSMAPSAIPRVKAALRAVRAADARALAERCLSLATCGEIEALVRERWASAGERADHDDGPGEPGDLELARSARASRGPCVSSGPSRAGRRRSSRPGAGSRPRGTGCSRRRCRARRRGAPGRRGARRAPPPTRAAISAP